MAAMTAGLRGEISVTVTPDKTAEAFGSGTVPVFATPAMVALLEAAACRALEGHLAPGETTVGIWLEVSHLAPTPVGARVRAEAELVAVEGRKLTFSVQAFDEREKIGEGRHHRMIVATDRFLARMRAKSTSGHS